MRVYQDKETGLWKIGSNGKAIHETEQAAKRAALNQIVDKILELQRKRQSAVK